MHSTLGLDDITFILTCIETPQTDAETQGNERMMNGKQGAQETGAQCSEKEHASSAY
jgi:hypothetical protein